MVTPVRADLRPVVRLLVLALVGVVVVSTILVWEAEQGGRDEGALGASPVVPSSITRCADVLVVGADGNAEAPVSGGVFGKTVQRAVDGYLALADGHRTVEVHRIPVQRPSIRTLLSKPHASDALRDVPVPRVRRWVAGVADARKRTNDFLAQKWQVCPHQQIVLVGYDQGAAVMHRVLAHLAARNALARVVGAVLVADPDRHSGGHADERAGLPAAARSHRGLVTRKLTPVDDVPAPGPTSTIWDVCTAGDLVCAPTHGAVGPSLRANEHYRWGAGASLLGQAMSGVWQRSLLWPTPDPKVAHVTATAGDPVSLQLGLAAPQVAGATWSVVGGLPPGLELSSDGLLSGSPTSAGSWTLTYAVAGTDPVTPGTLGAVTVTVSAKTVALSAGGQTSCAVRSSGKAYCWGRNNFGQVGDGTTTLRTNPARVLGTGWTSISTSGATTCGIKSPGTLWCWGLNNFGQLGTGISRPAIRPHQVGASSSWVSVSTSWFHTCGVKKSGDLSCWGSNRYGQLGQGSTSLPKGRPQLVKPAGAWSSVTAGGWHTCATRTDGTAWCWGQNILGQLGTGNVLRQTAPARVGVRSDWAELSASWDHTCGVSTSGQLRCWGYNHDGQVGDGTTITRVGPQQVGTGHVWTGVAAGSASTCASDADGALWCWGDNRYGQLGTDATRESHEPVPAQGGLHGPVTAGWLHACGYADDGQVACWGNNEAGQLGNGTMSVASGAKLPSNWGSKVSTLPSERRLDSATVDQVVRDGIGSRPSVPLSARRSARAGDSFVVVSYNTLGSQHTSPGADEPWFAPGRIRVEWGRQILGAKDASLVGTQELQPDQYLALNHAASGQYGFYPGSAYGYPGTPQSLMWRKSDWKLVWKHTISIPFVGGWRPQPVVRLQSKHTGAQIYFLNMHFSPNGRQAERDKATDILVAMIKKLQPDGLPIVLTGDFNEHDQIFCDITGRTQLEGWSGGNHDGGCHPPRPNRLDWIFGSRVDFANPLIDQSPPVQRATDHAIISGRLTLQ